MKQIYKFSATWCQPCKTLTARLAAKGIVLPEYDIDNPENAELLKRFGIRSVPTVVVVEGQSVQSFSGAALTPVMLEAIK